MWHANDPYGRATSTPIMPRGTTTTTHSPAMMATAHHHYNGPWVPTTHGRQRAPITTAPIQLSHHLPSLPFPYSHTEPRFHVADSAEQRIGWCSSPLDRHNTIMDDQHDDDDMGQRHWTTQTRQQLNTGMGPPRRRYNAQDDNDKVTTQVNYNALRWRHDYDAGHNYNVRWWGGGTAHDSRRGGWIRYGTNHWRRGGARVMPNCCRAKKNSVRLLRAADVPVFKKCILADSISIFVYCFCIAS